MGEKVNINTSSVLQVSITVNDLYSEDIIITTDTTGFTLSAKKVSARAGTFLAIRSDDNTFFINGCGSVSSEVPLVVTGYKWRLRVTDSSLSLGCNGLTVLHFRFEKFGAKCREVFTGVYDSITVHSEDQTLKAEVIKRG